MENTPEYSPPVIDSEEVPKWKRVLPDGVIFDPEDIEIFKNYLLLRVKGEYLEPGIIPEIDIYRCQPSQLPELNPEQASYFFTKTDKRFKNGKRLNRCTKDRKGYWRITSKINEIEDDDGNIIGRKNVLVYIEDKVKTNWIMHEYILDHNYVNRDEGDKFDTTSVVLCRIYERNAENNYEDSDGSSACDIQQNHKRASSSKSDDHEETSYYQAKRSKPSMNQTSSNSPLDVQPISQQPETTMTRTYWEEVAQSLDYQAQLYHPFDVQPISQQPEITMTRTYWEEMAQSLDYQAQLYHPFDVQPISQQPSTMMQTWYGEAGLPPLDNPMDQTQLPHLFDIGQPIIQQPATTTMQTFGEEALPLPSLDQMASNNFEQMQANLNGKIEGGNSDEDGNDFDKII